MTSTASPAFNNSNAAPGTTANSSNPGTTQPPARASYASAATKTATTSGPAIASSGPAVAVGSSQAQHAKSNSTVNGKVQPAVPTVGPPTIASSNPVANGVASNHDRKSSVTISATGSNGFMANGGPVGASGPRPNVTFGQMPSGGAVPSPAPVHSVPHQQHGSSLQTPFRDPRVTTPSHSPSPIPQPAASGGRPPMGISSQVNVPNFGSINNDHTNNGTPMQGPGTPNLAPTHIRRESSQSTHSNMSNVNMAPNFVPGAGRGANSRAPSYGYGQPQVVPSPTPSHRTPYVTSRGPGMPQFQSQGRGYMNSPGQAPRSPALASINPGMMGQQQHYANNPQAYGAYGGYPAGFPPTVSAPSPQPPTASVDKSLSAPQPNGNGGAFAAKKQTSPRHDFSRVIQAPDLSPASGGYEQYLTLMQTQGYYPGAQYDPSQYAAQYYQSQQYMQQNLPFHPHPGAPASPRPNYNAPQQFIPNQYPHAQSMSRTPSHSSERPSSSFGQPQGPPAVVTSTPNAPTPQPAQTPSTANFQRPAKKSAAIIIKNADGEVVDFNKKAPAAAPKPQGPVIASSGTTPTPPPRTPSASHNRTESKAGTDDAEAKKNEFQQKIKAQLEAENAKKADEEKKRKEDEAKAAKEKEEAEVKAAKDKEEAEAKAKAEAEEAAKKEAEEAARKKEEEERAKQEEEARAKKEADDAELERQIAEMEEMDRLEEERERAFQEKKKKENEEKAKREAEAKANEDEELKRQEREAEERELAREKEREQKTAEGPAADDKALFASLKKPTLGPGANESGASTPASDASASASASMPPPEKPTVKFSAKPKPSALKLETTKAVEPAQPTAGMQALKSARFLKVRDDHLKYPEGIASPNPSLNTSLKSRNGQRYDQNFLMQFSEVFKEKPSVDWDQKIKDTIGDSDSARPQSARTPSMRGPGSRPGMPPSGLSTGVMGNFVGGRTLPPNTTSEQRFAASSGRGASNMAANPFAAFGQGRGGFPAMGTGMARTPSSQSLAQGGMNSPRAASNRGRGSRRGDKPSHQEEAQKAKAMPLTAGMDLKPLELSKSGWKPTSIGTGMATVAVPNGHLTPDLVQRKVKAALNKMTPEKFDKIADQILEIASQSRNETDGRTLRQVIQLTFEKACDEAHWASMYAKFCARMLQTMSPDIKDENIKDKNGNVVTGGNLFRKYLLNRCQEEFERGWTINLPDKPEGESQEAALLTDDYYIAAAAKRRGLGLVQFIGELYKLGMLTTRIMHECAHKLLNFEGQPDEATIESLTKLLRTVGATMEKDERGQPMIEAYFQRIDSIMKQEGLPSRLHFMLLDVVDLRRSGWKSKDDTKGPKTIQEIHAEAQAAQAQADMERQRTNQRGGPGGRAQAGRGDVRSFSGQMPPQDYPRNQLGMDDLRKLNQKAGGNRQFSSGPSMLGPSSMFGSRSSSGRKNLGPMGGRLGEESGASSRTGTPPTKDKDASSTTASTNAFSALAHLDADNDVTSPPSEKTSPAITKAQPDTAAGDGKAS